MQEWEVGEKNESSRKIRPPLLVVHIFFFSSYFKVCLFLSDQKPGLVTSLPSE